MSFSSLSMRSHSFCMSDLLKALGFSSTSLSLAMKEYIKRAHAPKSEQEK